MYGKTFFTFRTTLVSTKLHDAISRKTIASPKTSNALCIIYWINRVSMFLPPISHIRSLFWSNSPPSGPGPPLSRHFYTTGNDTLQSVRLLASLRRDLNLTTHNTHNRQTAMSPAGNRTHNLSRRAAADLRLRPRGDLDWLNPTLLSNLIRLSLTSAAVSTSLNNLWTEMTRIPGRLTSCSYI